MEIGRRGERRCGADRAEELPVYERGQALGEQHQRDAVDHLVGLQPDAEDRHQRAERQPGADSSEHAHRDAVGVVGADEAAKGAGEHHALDAKVEVSRTLGQALADGSRSCGHRERHARAEQWHERRGADHLVPVHWPRASRSAIRRKMTKTPWMAMTTENGRFWSTLIASPPAFRPPMKRAASSTPVALMRPRSAATIAVKP